MSEQDHEPRISPPEATDDESVREYGRQLAMDSLLHELLRAQPAPDQTAAADLPQVVPVQPRGAGTSSSRLRKSSSARRSALVAVRPPLWNWRRGVAAAVAVLLLSTGALWLALRNHGRGERPLSPYEIEHRQALLEEVKELDQALSTVQAAPPHGGPDITPDPLPNTTDEDELAADRESEAEEAASLLEARRASILSELGLLEPRRPLAGEADVDEAVVNRHPTRGQAAVENTQKIGRVVLADSSDRAGVLVRDAEGAALRLNLDSGMDLQSGDRIETTAGGQEARASVALDGGATLDLARNTVVEVVGRNEMRLQAGRVYATVAVPREKNDRARPPFSLQTEGGRFLASAAEAEIFSSPDATRLQTGARVCRGKVHVVNSKGYVVASKGQEVQLRRDAMPAKTEGFSAALWRGQDRFYDGLPFGSGSALLYSSYLPAERVTTCYLLALSHRGEIPLAGLQVSLGDHQESLFRQLVKDVGALQQSGIRGLPHQALGAKQPLRPPLSGRLEDTLPDRSPAVLQIVACAQTATAEKPLLFIAGGALTDLASAWLFDHTIAERVILVVRNKPQQWDLDSWSTEIVLRHFRCVLTVGTTLKVGPDRLVRVPDPRWSELLGRKAEFADDSFRMVALVTTLADGRKVNRFRFAGLNGKRPMFEGDPKGNIWWPKDPGERELLEEFDRVVLAPPVP